MKTSKQLLNKISLALLKVPKLWDGKTAITEMKNNKCPHWRQMEWIGWYFQYLCEKHLSEFFEIPGQKFGRVEFDGFAEITWDFKVHPVKNSKGQISNNVIANDKNAMKQAIKKFGRAGIILAVGEAIFNDEERSFQIWHKELKGGLSEYEKDRIKRGVSSRLRKTAFKLQKIILLEIDENSIKKHSSFQKGFRNSDGSPRKSKLLLNLNKIDKNEILRIK